MRPFAAASLVFLTALGVGTSLARGADIGANDDSAKYALDGGTAMYEQMHALGLKQVVIGVDRYGDGKLILTLQPDY